MEQATIAVYEARAEEWRDRRGARFLDRVERLTREIADLGGAGSAVTADLGCGAGLHLPHLPRPAVALDAAGAMVALAREAAPDVPGVRADLEALPFRRGAIGAGWARASYLHIPRRRLPWALMELHQALAVDAPAHFTLIEGEGEGPHSDDPFTGRFFARWMPDEITAVLEGAGFEIVETAAEGDGGDRWLHVLARRARTLPDFVGPGMRLLVCGLNPSVRAADAGVGFVTANNRFWPAALAAGIATRDRNPRHAFLRHGIGMTDLVKRASVAAKEITTAEYRVGAARVARIVEWLQPGAVCFVGLAGYRVAVDRDAQPGVQPRAFGGVPAYVMPNTSGLNARFSLEDLAEHLRHAAWLADPCSAR